MRALVSLIVEVDVRSHPELPQLQPHDGYTRVDQFERQRRMLVQEVALAYCGVSGVFPPIYQLAYLVRTGDTFVMSVDNVCLR
jgi:hypothetical protein